MEFRGRKKLEFDTRDYNLADHDDVLAIIDRLSGDIRKNQKECHELWKIRDGEQRILKRQEVFMLKDPNRVVENRVGEAVDTYLSYLLSKPVQYINNSLDTPSEAIDNLNKYMELASKDSDDVDLYEELLTCGVAYRNCEPNKLFKGDSDAPFKTRSISGRHAFVIYESNTDEPVLVGVKTRRQAKDSLTSIHTIEVWSRAIYVMRDNIMDKEPVVYENAMGELPIVEYTLNQSRAGMVEKGLALQNAINTLDSLSLDGIHQMVQFIIAIINGKEISKEARKEIEESGGGWLFMTDLDEHAKADIKFLVNDFDKKGITELKADLLAAFYSIMLMPNRKSGASDQNAAGVLLGSGFSQLIGNCRRITTRLLKPERDFLRLALRHMRAFPKSNEKIGELEDISQIGIRWYFNLHDNILLKGQAFQNFMTAGIAPAKALEWCEISADPDGDVLASEEYQKKIGYDWSNFVGQKEEIYVERREETDPRD